MQAEWKINGVFKADASLVADEIQSIGSTVTTGDLVEFARNNKESELHKCFEWNNDIAAEKYRKHQAGKVIRLLVVNGKSESDKEIRGVRLFVNTEHNGKYKQIQNVFKVPDEYSKLLHRAKEELKAFANRYEKLSELETVVQAIREL